MSSRPPFLDEIQKIVIRRARMRRLMIAGVILVLVSAFGLTGWLVWERHRPKAAYEDTAPEADASRYPGATPAGQPAGPAAANGDAFVAAVPRAGVETGSSGPPEEPVGVEEPVLRTEAVLEDLASRRAMEERTGEQFDARAEAMVAERLLNNILAAVSADEIVPHVRHGEALRPLIADFAQRAEGRRLPDRVGVRGASLVDVEGLPVLLLQLNDRLFREAAFVQDGETGDWLLDWESFVGFSLLSWDELRESKPATPTYVRAYALLADYYNFEFADAGRYVSLRLDSPDNFHAIYAYVERDSPLAEEILGDLANRRVRPALMLIRYPESSLHDNQVIVDDVIAWRWMDVRDAPTGHFIGAARQADGAGEGGKTGQGDAPDSDDEQLLQQDDGSGGE